MTKKKYFGDSPKAVKIFARKYHPAAETENDPSTTPSRPPQQLPTARELAEYDALFEGAGERIVKLLEKEQAQRHSWENKALKAQNLGRRIGQGLFALILLAIIYAGMCLIQSGQVIAALIFVALVLATLVSAICLNNKHRFSSEKRNHFSHKQHRQ